MDIKTVQHIAKLSHLRLSEDEMEHFAKELSSILSYASELDKVNVKDVQPTGHAVAAHNVFRADETARQADAEHSAGLVSAAPDKEDGYVKVKAIL
ncbi:Asp-tRNA(Asn)/Glu-tRNA(Gln) amidotransferase subunit GatC [Candidatus Azambacteria bacterium]|nr:Asp-tRNA(Asn)/Glu-tRNA(Gln) amidotransferase subunit GatC [Candidatus Azambacteria bacterium]MBI3685368.1 Asp-tRNA(Asn)/Glu-tRNA(Gln) amidotransferase subunit GatC [Candidatus Azambacteria bacterium]